VATRERVNEVEMMALEMMMMVVVVVVVMMMPLQQGRQNPHEP
jgi:hypothetical protein